MTPKDFVYDQIYKSAINKGSMAVYAQQRAVIGVRAYLRNSYKGKVGDMISAEVKEALRLTKASR